MEGETALSDARDALLAAKRVFAAVNFDCTCVEVAAADVFSTVAATASPDTDVRVPIRFVKEAEADGGGTVPVSPAEERVFGADVSVSTADALNKVRRLTAVSAAADETFAVLPAAAVILPACNCLSVRTEGFAVSAAEIVFRFGFTLDFFSNMFFSAGLCCGVFEVSSPPMPYYTTEKEILSTGMAKQVLRDIIDLLATAILPTDKIVKVIFRSCWRRANWQREWRQNLLFPCTKFRLSSPRFFQSEKLCRTFSASVTTENGKKI